MTKFEQQLLAILKNYYLWTGGKLALAEKIESFKETGDIKIKLPSITGQKEYGIIWSMIKYLAGVQVSVPDHRLAFMPFFMSAFGNFTLTSLRAGNGFLNFEARQDENETFLKVNRVLCDMLDGTIARRFCLETRFGLIFDSVADRVSETSVVLGALLGRIIEPLGIVAVIGSVVLLLFRTLSYVHGLNTDYVLFSRVHRLVFIMFGLISSVARVSTYCFIIAGTFGIVSSIQIIIHLWRQHHII
jgi:phosphatidylglycerophosphate synthase